MALQPHDLPDQIRMVTEEEQHWRMIAFKQGSNGAHILDVGRLLLSNGEPAYYRRVLMGGTQPEHITGLSKIKPEVISRDKALGLRATNEAWRRRPIIAGHLIKLYNGGFFDREPMSDGTLYGYREADAVDHPDRCHVVRVMPDGEVALRVEDPSYEEDQSRVLWHEYRLPRSVYFVEHEVEFEGAALPETRRIIDPHMLVSNMVAQLSSLSLYVTHETKTA